MPCLARGWRSGSGGYNGEGGQPPNGLHDTWDCMHQGVVPWTCWATDSLNPCMGGVQASWPGSAACAAECVLVQPVDRGGGVRGALGGQRRACQQRASWVHLQCHRLLHRCGDICRHGHSVRSGGRAVRSCIQYSAATASGLIGCEMCMQAASHAVPCHSGVGLGP